MRYNCGTPVLPIVLQAEHRRLLWEKAQIWNSDEAEEESETTAKDLTCNKILNRAAKRLEVSVVA